MKGGEGGNRGVTLGMLITRKETPTALFCMEQKFKVKKGE